MVQQTRKSEMIIENNVHTVGGKAENGNAYILEIQDERFQNRQRVIQFYPVGFIWIFPIEID